MNVHSDVAARLDSLLKAPTPVIPDSISYVLFDPKTERNRKRVVLGNIVDKEMLKEKTEEEDESRPEATFRFTVENFSKLEKEKLSPAVFIRNLPWRICVKPWSDSSKKSLGVFVKCDADSKSLWSCRASGELRLIPQKNGVQTFTENVDQVFYNKGKSWGRRQFIPWHEVCDPQKGYIKDDKIVLEAYVKAGAPCGEKEIVLDKLDLSDTGEDLMEEEVAEEEESQSEATFRFTVENFSKVEGKKISQTVFIRNLPWKIFAKPHYDPNTNNKTLGFFLQCDASCNSLWSCHATAELRLIPQKKVVQTLRKKLERVFYSNANNRGSLNSQCGISCVTRGWDTSRMTRLCWRLG
uniref:MATH domain-containing protein n=1 Tax=Branchiostoma floridae TaxID=7739 RepID=C3XXM0_BRAFL|eukprot:XP_002611470.1 hypothetical protein BRAFLDRAFT_63896 [Branchiostoma floridae]